jgi:hypothetical protein
MMAAVKKIFKRSPAPDRSHIDHNTNARDERMNDIDDRRQRLTHALQVKRRES